MLVSRRMWTFTEYQQWHIWHPTNTSRHHTCLLNHEYWALRLVQQKCKTFINILSGHANWSTAISDSSSSWGLGASDLPDTDQVVGVPSEQCLAISRPGQWDAVWWLGFAAKGDNLRFQVINNWFGFQIPNLDAWSSSSAKPVSVGAEAQSVDHDWHTVSGQGVQVFALIEIPEHGHAVFASGCTQGTVWWNCDCVEESSMPNVICLYAAVGQIPNLDQSVPSTGNDDWVLGVWRESYTWNPLFVALIFDGVFTLSKCIPQFNTLVSGSWNNLSVISREGKERTSLVCPTNVRVVFPACKSHNLRVWSQDPERANCPSEDMTTSDTKWLCPCRRFLAVP